MQYNKQKQNSKILSQMKQKSTQERAISTRMKYGEKVNRILWSASLQFRRDEFLLFIPIKAWWAYAVLAYFNWSASIDRHIGHWPRQLGQTDTMSSSIARWLWLGFSILQPALDNNIDSKWIDQSDKGMHLSMNIDWWRLRLLLGGGYCSRCLMSTLLSTIGASMRMEAKIDQWLVRTIYQN